MLLIRLIVAFYARELSC